MQPKLLATQELTQTSSDVAKNRASGLTGCGELVFGDRLPSLGSMVVDGSTLEDLFIGAVEEQDAPVTPRGSGRFLGGSGS